MIAAKIETASQFSDSPAGWAERWKVELHAAREEVKRWHESGEKIRKRYLDERESERNGDSRWNLFAANVQTQEALLYGRVPQVSVSRRFADSSDDVARVAGEMLERLLNADIERDGDSYAEALGYALSDRLLPGLGVVRIRYVTEMEVVPGTPPMLAPDGSELAPAVPETQRKVYECVETDYVHWRDVLWSPARVWHEVRWVAFRAEMSKDQVSERFGKEVAARIPYELSHQTQEEREQGRQDPWARAVVWEIWDKPSRRVYWYVEGYGETLDMQDDPLKLARFFPCPRPLLANTTTSKVLPRPDFVLAQDLYDEVDLLSTRINLLTQAVRVRGAYDSSCTGLKALLATSGGNDLVPVENWAMFAEKGGFKGAIDWLPLEQIVNAITVLDQRREVVKAALYEVTGMSDLMRGQQAMNGTPGEAEIKARFASVRLQRLQEEFARFASDVQRLKAEVVAQHFDKATIQAQSNVAFTQDADLAPQAIALLKERFKDYRVQVKPEAVSLTDFAAQKAERSEIITALSTFFQSMAPVAGSLPGGQAFVLELAKWTVSGLRGASEMEGLFDRAIAQAKEAMANPQPAPPDPKVMAQQMKGAQDLQKIQAETQARLVEINAEVDADARREQNQMQYNVREAAAKAQLSAATRAQQGMQPGMPRGER